MSTTSSRIGYAAITQPFGCAAPIVHCPICGQAVIEVTDGVGEVRACAHLAFVYIGAVCEFEYQSPAFEARTARKQTPAPENLKRWLKSAGYGGELLALEISYGGMACGPVWHTDVYGFDWSTVDEAEEE